MITVLAGGVGAARFLSGLIQIEKPENIRVVVNTGDDFILHGLYICPDIDTIRYTLTNDVGSQGWGRSNETWHALGELKNLAQHAPERSRATDWFALGDRDIATHLYRTQRLREGADLTQVTGELSQAASLRLKLLPMTNDRVATMLTMEDGETIDFQEYFVKRRHAEPVMSIQFEGNRQAKASREALDAIADAERLIIAPSNPVLSIGPLLALPELAAVLRSQRHRTIAISPLINGKAVKGPADHLMAELGLDSSVVGVANYLDQYAGHMVADEADIDKRASIEALGFKTTFAPTLMSTPKRARELAKVVMSATLDD
jgi:LPPG:FO 2-phospho-L-lactate transferase